MTNRGVVGALAVALLVVTGACGGDDASSDGPPATEAPGSGPVGTGDRGGPRTPAELCTAVLNDRDADVAETGREAALQVVLWGRDDTPPAPDEAEAATDALEAWRDLLVADRERLAEAEVDDAAAWDEVLGGIDAEVERLEERLAVLAAPDWQEAAGGLAVGSAPDEPTSAPFEALDLVGRDCEIVAVGTGTPPEDAAFVAAAATACSTVVTRRRANGFRDDLDVVLDAFVAVYEGEEVAADDALVAALDRVGEEWEATHDDLVAVDGDQAPDPEAWAQVVELAADRAAGYARRAEAVRSGDQAEVAEAFVASVLGDPGLDGFAPNGLSERDCRSIEA